MRTKFDEQIQKKGFLIAAHRGTFGANIMDNTFLSMDLAIKLGADMVEVDVMKANDGELYAFHTGKEIERFGKKFNITELNSDEIAKLDYLNAERQPSGRGVERLEDILRKCSKEAFINIDRADKYFPEVFALVEKLGIEDKILMKSQPTDDIAEFLDKTSTKLMYMPIIRKIADLDKFLDKNINIVAVEILFNSENHELISKEFIQAMRERNIHIWVNAMNLSAAEEFNYNARYDDDMSLEHDGKGWQWLLDNGVDILQTDWPYFLNQYRLNLNCK